MDRKELLLQAPDGEKITPEEAKRLRQAAEVGGMYLALVSSTGWKHLVENYISKQISQDRYLLAETEDLADIRAAQKAIFDLLRYVNNAIDAGQKSYERLQKEGSK